MNNESSRITNTESKLLEPELCYKIQGAIFDVSNKYGKGLKKRIYQNALTPKLDIHRSIYTNNRKSFIIKLQNNRNS
jgi:hypothetical protein